MKPIIMAFSLLAMQLDAQVDPASAENFMRHALTQGGLLSLVVLGGWSYRRDFIRQADEIRELAHEKAQQIKILTDTLTTTAVANTRSAEALIQCTAALNTQAQSIQAMSQVLGELKGVMSRRADHA